MSFSVKLKTSEFEQMRLVVGPIWLELDGQTFPDDGWDDFPVVILGWWLNAVKPLIANEGTECECLFMDGRYKFKVKLQTHASWTQLSGDSRPIIRRSPARPFAVLPHHRLGVLPLGSP